MVDVEIRWVLDNPDYGAQHIREKHKVTKEEVEEVLLERPPEVEARRHKDYPERTVFFGETRMKRCLFISCEDFVEDERRVLLPITAFSPDNGWAYWTEWKNLPPKGDLSHEE